MTAEYTIFCHAEEPSGKHYGTTLRISHPILGTGEIEIWLPMGEPHDKEYDWEYFDCHYRSKLEVEICNAIVSALDGLKVQAGEWIR